MKRSFLLILIFTLLICGCARQEQPVPTEVPAVSSPAAQTEEGERMFSSMVYATLDTEGKRIWVGPEAGIREFRVPDAFINAKGGIRAFAGFETDAGTGLTRTDIMYIPASEEAYDRLVDDLAAVMAGGMSDEASIKKIEDASVNFQNSLAVLFSVIGVPNNGDPETAKKLMLNGLMNAWLLTEEEARKELDSYSFIPAGQAADYSFYLSTFPGGIRNAFDGDKASWREEYDQLYADVPSYTELFTFARPQGLANMTASGTALRFETSDLNGEPISSGDLFSGHKVTMVNIWSTTCAGCISEMPELNRMSKEFEAKGGQIVGVVYDAESADLIDEAKEIVSDLGVGYKNLLPAKEIKQTLAVQSFPTTYFVNEKGELKGDPVVGAQLASYRRRMEEQTD